MRLTRSTLALATIGLLVMASSARAQGQGGTGGIGTGTSLGTGGQGSRIGQSTSFSLSTRFQSNFDRFTQGSAAVGQVVPGAAAAGGGLFGSGTGGNFSTLGVGLGGLGGGLGGRGGLNFGVGFGRSNFGQQGQQGNTQTQRTTRAKMVLGFNYPGLPTSVVNTKVQQTLSRAIVPPAGSSVQVTMQGSTAVLSGTVASDHDRVLAGNLAMLEPGIANVQNDLVVAVATEAPATPGR